MDRLEFLSITKSDSPFDETIITFFDQIMAIYELIGMSCKGIFINKNDQNSSVVITIAVGSYEEAVYIYNMILEKIILAYGHKYMMIPEITDTLLNIILKEESD